MVVAFLLHSVLKTGEGKTMFKKFSQLMTQAFGARSSRTSRLGAPKQVGVLRKGHAMRVIFFYPGEEGTYVDHADVTLFENGIIHIQSNQEETTTHLQNCEILWRFEVDGEDRANKVRLLKPKADGTKQESLRQHLTPEDQPDPV